MITVAEIERAECYYFLGLRALEKENWLLASKLLFLSNSEEADSELDLCYYQLAEMAFDENDSLKAISFYSKIKDYLPDSEYRERVLINMIDYYHYRGEDSLAFENYMIFENHFPESDKLSELSNQINDYVLSEAEELYLESDLSNYENDLNLLKQYLELPLPGKAFISNLVGEFYKKIGDQSYLLNQYGVAFNYYQVAINYKPSLQDNYSSQKKRFIDNILEQGELLEQAGKYDDAISQYNKGLEVFPENSDFIKARQNIYSVIYQADLAQKAFEKAENLNEEEKFSKALQFYKQSYSYLKTKEVSDKISLMENLIQAEKNPKGFALDIILDYKNGKLEKKINDLFVTTRADYGDNLVTKSDWKILYYSGKYKYEVRNDILSPVDNYYFAWMVDLTKRAIVPLNKLSESFLDE